MADSNSLLNIIIWKHCGSHTSPTQSECVSVMYGSWPDSPSVWESGYARL